jgi:N-acetylglucosamine malate deacetylase 1
MNVLVLAPHPDDEAIGCGGALRMHADAGDRITVVFLSSGELGLKHLPKAEAWRIREGEAEAAGQQLGVSRIEFLRKPDWFVSDHTKEAADFIHSLSQQEQPDLIYLPHPDEWHPDHKAASAILRRLCGVLPDFSPRLLAYEIWTPMQEATELRNISCVITRKMRALRCYASQLSRFRYDRAIRGLNQYRGIMAGGCAYAEAFEGLSLNKMRQAAGCE